MFAISFDLTVKITEQLHPGGTSGAYRDIGRKLAEFGFEQVQGSMYVTTRDDLANLTAAILALKAMAWFPPSVWDIRAFRMESLSDFTALVKQQ
jgi:virulence-associated protein VapD